LVADDSAHPPPQQGVLLVGSSSIRMWTTLAADFPGVPVIDRGFGGSAIADTTYRSPGACRKPRRCQDIDGGEESNSPRQFFWALQSKAVFRNNLPARSRQVIGVLLSTPWPSPAGGLLPKARLHDQRAQVRMTRRGGK
jgi:hypothetical protein